jgi:UDP-N-acetylmuramyl pentapeptide phosphotransferase/UDP-N-acetylglucosamine-1-phosphate transferase
VLEVAAASLLFTSFDRFFRDLDHNRIVHDPGYSLPAAYKKKITYRRKSKLIPEPMKKKVPAAIVITIWLLIISIFMFVTNRIDLAIFFVLWVIGLLVIVELIDTHFSSPPSMRYLKYIIAAGIIIIGAIFSTKVMEFLLR